MTAAQSPAGRPRPRRPRLTRLPRLPRLIATDLDGTLLRGDKTVSARSRAALAAAEDAGIEVILVTGRPARWLSVINPIRTGSLAICANGAAVVDPGDGCRLVEIHPLNRSAAARITGRLLEVTPGVTFAVDRTGGLHYEPDYPPLFPDPSAVVAPVEKLLAPGAFHGQPILKLLAHHRELDPDGFLDLARDTAGAEAEFTRSSPSALLEISAPGVSKASTLARFCARRGIRAEEVLAFGDMPNDLPMLDWAGTAYAMANAHPAVLAATPLHTAANEEDGVAAIIEQLLAAAS